MITQTFDRETPEIINPNTFVAAVPGFPKVAIVSFGPRFIDKLLELYDTQELCILYACGPHPVYHVQFEGTDIAVYKTSLGGPATVGLQEEIYAKGAEKILYFGSCGVLDKTLEEMTFILPTAAYRDEGTSYHYASASEFIEVPTAPRMAEIFNELNLPHHCGKTWTTDAIYRETRGNMEKRKATGCIVVEMECASIMAAAQFRNKQAYQFLYAADNLDATEWDARTLGNFPTDKTEKILRVALEVAKRI
ncbi:MAG: nucleoside phosphorylase [Defluviitaleaceae bacterium]|nr:nucleoside phosphorylase [Defluviitaleaceae bacterium]